MGLPNLQPLYAIVDIGSRGHPRPLEFADELFLAGVRWVQLRAKSLPTGELLALAAELVRRGARHGSKIIVNDRLDIALASDAAGVHLGQDDLSPAGVLPVARPRGLVVGVSTHTADQAIAAEAVGADYIGFGPMFPTTTKADALEPRATEELRATRQAVDLPIVAIGGITEATAPSILAAGADSVAMISALAISDDPQELAKRLTRLPNHSS